MQTNSPSGVRNWWAHGKGVVRPCLQPCQVVYAVAILTLVFLGPFVDRGFGQVNEPSYVTPVQPSSQLESLLGYGNSRSDHAVSASFESQRSATEANLVEIPASRISNHQVYEPTRPTATSSVALTATWKPQAMADAPSTSAAGPDFSTASLGSSVPLPDNGRPERTLTATPVGFSDHEIASRDPLDQRLPGPSQSSARQESSGNGLTPGFGQGAKNLLQTGVALAVVLGLVFAFLWLFKRTAPKSLLPLPIETVQVLGNAPLHGKQHLRLIRLGQRVLLLAVSETTSQTLAEVTDPDEVRYLLEMCQRKNSRDESQTFDAILREGRRERATGFLGSQQEQIAQSLGSRGSRDTPPDTRETTKRSAARPVSNHFFEA